MGSLPCTPSSRSRDAAQVASNDRRVKHFRMSVTAANTEGVADESDDANLEDMYNFEPATVASLNAVASLSSVVDRLQDSTHGDDMYEFDPVTVASLSTVAQLNAVVEKIQHNTVDCPGNCECNDLEPPARFEKTASSHCDFDYRSCADIRLEH